MARTYGNRIQLELSLPSSVLDDPRCPAPVVDALGAFAAAELTAAEAHDEVDALSDRFESEDVDARAAARGGRKLPTMTPEAVRVGALGDARRAERVAVSMAGRAAGAFEKSIRTHRAAIRPLLVEALPEQRDAAAEAIARARTAAAVLGSTIELAKQLDHSVVELGDRAAVAQHYAGALRGSRPINNLWDPDAAWQGLALFPAGLDVEQLLADPLDPDALKTAREAALNAQWEREGTAPAGWRRS